MNFLKIIRMLYHQSSLPRIGESYLVKKQQKSASHLRRTASPLSIDILRFLEDLETMPLPLLDELSEEALYALFAEMDAWLEEVEPRTTRYIKRRAAIGISVDDPDAKMQQDLFWYRLFRANLQRWLTLLLASRNTTDTTS